MKKSPIRPDAPPIREHAAAIVKSGGVIAFRTDTFYGLGADPLNPSAVQRVCELKGREESNPILVLVSDESEVDRFLQTSPLFRLVAAHHWPGALTLVGKSTSALPIQLTANTETLGVRLPADESVRELVRCCGGALTATSANISGEPVARTANEVEAYFPNGVDLIIDGGEVTATAPSTVLDVRGAKARLVREGAVSRDALKAFL